MTFKSRFTLLFTIILPAVAMAAGERCERVHLPSPLQITDTIITRHIGLDRYDQESITAEARGALPKLKEGCGMSASCWGLTLAAPDDTLKVSLRFGNSDFGDFTDRRISVITVTRGNEELYSESVSGFHTGADRFNTLSVTLSDNTLSVSGGGEHSRKICDLNLDRCFRPCESSVWNVGTMRLSVFSTEVCHPPYKAFASGITREDLDRRFATTTDPVEGYWRYFDRTNDPMFARLGGRYTLAVIRSKNQTETEGSYPVTTYDIVYIDGAQTKADDWSPMMLKGALRSTIFEGHYDMEWIDSTFETITDDISATITERSLLTLNFPLLKTTIRFSKVPTR